MTTGRSDHHLLLLLVPVTEAVMNTHHVEERITTMETNVDAVDHVLQFMTEEKSLDTEREALPHHFEEKPTRMLSLVFHEETQEMSLKSK
jgi:hypothetical protein